MGGLSNVDRGYLEQTIDNQISQIPDLSLLIHTDQFKQHYQFTNSEDMIFGMVLGSIYNNFSNYYINVYRIMAPPESVAEANSIIFKRLEEIKEAISKCS